MSAEVIAIDTGMVAPLVLSASAVQTYLGCEYAYYLGSVRRTPGEPSVAAALGTAVHAAIEAYHRQNDPRAARTALHASWDAVAHSDAIASDPEALGAMADGERMLGAYIASRGSYVPRYIETPFIMTIEGIVVSGQIDLADDDVRDIKTTNGKTIAGRRPPPFHPDRYDFQLSLYALGYEQITGHPPRRLCIDLLTRRGAYREYERPFRPQEVVDVLGLVSEGIERGEFRPTGAAAGLCRWCAWKNKCSFAVVED